MTQITIQAKDFTTLPAEAVLQLERESVALNIPYILLPGKKRFTLNSTGAVTTITVDPGVYCSAIYSGNLLVFHKKIAVPESTVPVSYLDLIQLPEQESVVNAYSLQASLLSNQVFIDTLASLITVSASGYTQAESDLRFAPISHSHSLATTSTPGFLAAADFTKLAGVEAGATANATNAALRDRATHTGTQPASTITGLGTAALANTSDFAPTAHTHSIATGSTAGFFSAGDFTKLAGIESGATANATNAALRDRATHTGTQPASTITGLGTAALADVGSFATAAQGLLAGTALQPGAIGSTVQGFDPDLQAIGALSGGTGYLRKTAENTWILDIPSGGGGGGSGGGGATDAELRDRATHTGTQPASTITGLGTAATANTADFAPTAHSHSLATGSTPGFLAAADFTKLAGIESGATANATNAALRDRATHTGTQPASTITGLGTAALANTTDFAPISHNHSLATGSTAGFFSAGDFTKLTGIESGATANATNAALRDRATHTGTQPASTITGLGTAALADVGSFATAAQGLLAGTALQPAAIGSTVQGFDADLQAIGALSGGTGYLRKTAENTWTLDTPSGGGSTNFSSLPTDSALNIFEDFLTYHDQSANLSKKINLLDHPFVSNRYCIINEDWLGSYALTNGAYINKFLGADLNGTNSSASNRSTNDWLRVGTGTTTVGRSTLASGNTIRFTSGKTWIFKTQVYLSNLGDGTNNFACKVGYDNSTASASGSNCILFRYLQSENTNWRCRIVKNGIGVSPIFDTGILPATTPETAQTLEIRYTVGSQCQFFIDNVLVYTVNNVDLPVGSAEPSAINVGIYKTAGTADRAFFCKYLTVLGEF